MTAISDTYRLVTRWREAGVPDEQAGKMVTALNEELDQNLATKADLALAMRDLKIWIGQLLAAHFVLMFTALAAIKYFG